MEKDRLFLLLLFLLLIQFCLSVNTASGQKVTFRDSLDHAFDMSDWVINAHGFVPVPVVITEPALGYGGAMAAVLIHPRTQPEIYRRHPGLAHVRPDITAVGGMYTASGSWAMFAARSGTFIKPGISYKVATGYTSLNLSFYPRIKGDEHQVKVNLKSLPVFVQALKQLGYSNLQAGLRYVFSRTEVSLLNALLPDSVFSPRELDNINSMPGVLIEFDNRDNVFTPQRGTRAHFHANWSDNIFGSDFDYVNLEAYAYHYIPFGDRWVCGLRGDMQQVFGDAPFYRLPYIELRGIARARYQGKINTTVETEQRWNFLRRWSAVIFGGVGKAFDQYSEFAGATWAYACGVGGRYLLARKLNLYMGADLARGPEQWGFYVQFGSAWTR